MGKFENVLAAAFGNPGHDYPEDHQQENGMYLHHCFRCTAQFTGHKYRFSCKVCTAPQPTQPPPKKGERRMIDGVIWTCTDPDIDRWVSVGSLVG
ncbi:hypothetical protein [Paraburkholderia sp. BCC1886]|uniref:hypothetical protein n=1 Tax=Paraburkholderia sp. BCC1886 TaxID=2562670 RepID=UPI001181CB10|nr:hypothetical protein [Paraburkholderia sp. BCC1886]